MRWRASHDVKRRAPEGALLISESFLLAGFGEAALVASSRVLVDQTFARSAVEEPNSRQFLLSGPARRALERGAEGGFLGAVADGSGA